MHKAAGGEAKHTPGRFTITEACTGLVGELSRNQDKSPISSRRGMGTYVCKELVYAYAMWISPAFHLKVIRAPGR
ncbi:KilA-N domain-containing protein [Ectothiorhodospira shaposhnikovii]|uniref:KilA-N domain-containing protein n=1 Tax=Ectothiorhodospira shaposhnikovii TaxID=1054 RepID=UPI003B8A995C